jgi:hypothetical protein
MGQIEGANESVASAMNRAIKIRECQLAIRIKYKARKRSETVIYAISKMRVANMPRFSVDFPKIRFDRRQPVMG